MSNKYLSILIGYSKQVSRFFGIFSRVAYGKDRNDTKKLVYNPTYLNLCVR